MSKNNKRRPHNTTIYGKMGQLSLPIAYFKGRYKAGKYRTRMMSRLSNDMEIHDNPPKIWPYRKWKSEIAVDNGIYSLEYGDIIGAVQVGRSGLSAGMFTSFFGSKQTKDAVIKETRWVEQEKRYAHLKQCSHQGQRLRWEGELAERKLNHKELWEWESTRLSFLIKSPYYMLPCPANLVRRNISDDPKSKCGQNDTLWHILSACMMRLKKRYTWRYNQILNVFWKWLRNMIDDFNERNIPTRQVIKKLQFHQVGRRKCGKTPRMKLTADDRWKLEGGRLR